MSVVQALCPSLAWITRLAKSPQLELEGRLEPQHHPFQVTWVIPKLKSRSGGHGVHNPSHFSKEADTPLEALHSLTLSVPAPHRPLPTAVQWSAGVVFPWQFWPSLQQDCSLFYLPLCIAREEPCYHAWPRDRLNRVPAHISASCEAPAGILKLAESNALECRRHTVSVGCAQLYSWYSVKKVLNCTVIAHQWLVPVCFDIHQMTWVLEFVTSISKSQKSPWW